MHQKLEIWILFFFLACASHANGEIVQRVVDIPTRPGINQRMVVLTPQDAKAAVILFAGSHGGLQISPDGSFKWGAGNFLVRSRQLFAEQGLLVVVVDAPSDRQNPPYLSGFRPAARTCRRHQSRYRLGEGAGQSACLAGRHKPGNAVGCIMSPLNSMVRAGPDGLVLSSTILTDKKERPVPAMPLGNLRVPVLVVHHEQDACSHCSFNDIRGLMEKLGNTPRKQLLTFKGGQQSRRSVRGLCLPRVQRD